VAATLTLKANLHALLWIIIPDESSEIEEKQIALIASLQK